jgi:uncharacterized membrane protein
MEIASHIHVIATAVGVICAIVSAALMLNLKTDDHIRKRARIARSIAPFTWLAFIALIISGVILTLNRNDLNIPIMVTKHILVTILLIDALLIHFRHFPRLFAQIGTPECRKTYTTMRRIGTLSVSCWVIILILSFLLGRMS